MADEYTWKLSEIRTEWRSLTGRSSTADISDINVNKLINDYYTNYFPEDAKVDDLNDWLTQALSVDDSGEYTLAQTVLKIMEPVTVNGNEVTLYLDKQLFFEKYPEDEQYITSPGIAIGSSDSKKVKHDDFDYDIAGDSYSKSSSEVDLTGDAVPAGKYGAWSLKIDSDGTITVTAAGDNATGYDTPALAVAVLSVAASSEAFMGFITATKSDGAFTPATTALDASNVTDTYTDGQPKNRNTPEAVLRYGGKLYTRPKPDDIYELKAPIRKRPTVLADDDAVPDDVKWGPMIALGAAILFLVTKGEQDRVIELTGAPVSLTEFRMNSIANKQRIQNQNRHTKTSF